MPTTSLSRYAAHWSKRSPPFAARPSSPPGYAASSITPCATCIAAADPSPGSPKSWPCSPACRAAPMAATCTMPCGCKAPSPGSPRPIATPRCWSPASSSPMPKPPPSSALQRPPCRGACMKSAACSARSVAQARAAPPPPPYPGKMLAQPWTPPYHDEGRDRFTATTQNPFKLVSDEPVSTFSIDVDTASYAFVRASLNRSTLPQPAAVRTEELVNYFPYDYAAPTSAAQPFSTNVAVFPSPWNAGRKLVRIGIRGYDIQRAPRPRANLVFLIDTSGSMTAPNKLPLVNQAHDTLPDCLHGDVCAATATYPGFAGTALAPTPASQKARIRAVIDSLGAGGGTAGAEGIRQAYTLAEQNLAPRGVNRVILATDGAFNIGITDDNELKGYVDHE